MLEFYSEVFLSDAMRLCQYIAGEDGAISVESLADTSDFPDFPDGIEKPSQGNMVVVTKGGEVVAQCLYKFLKDDDGTLKKRDRWLSRLMFGDEFRRAREEKGMSIGDVARLTGYRPHAIEMIERGRYELRLEPMYRLASAVGCIISLKNK